MDEIKVAVLSEHKLLLDGICGLLNDLDSIKVILKETSLNSLLKHPDLKQVHILLLNPDVLDARVLNLIVRMSVTNPRVMILILSMAADEDTIHKSIKAGAKGFLSRDSDRDDLLEALHTLRNGHDYYSKSITRILLKQYIKDLKSDSPSPRQKELNSLSARELEILTLWGNSYTNSEISEELFISIRTVETHKSRIMQKLNLKTAVDMVKFAIRNNIINI